MAVLRNRDQLRACVDPAFPSRVVRYALVGPDNVIATIPPGEYPAPYECAGEEVKEAGHFNFWWVKIVAGSEEDPLVGWVPAVLVAGGDDDEPIPGVPQRPTEFE